MKWIYCFPVSRDNTYYDDKKTNTKKESKSPVESGHNDLQSGVVNDWHLVVQGYKYEMQKQLHIL